MNILTRFAFSAYVAAAIRTLSCWSVLAVGNTTEQVLPRELKDASAESLVSWWGSLGSGINLEVILGEAEPSAIRWEGIIVAQERQTIASIVAALETNVAAKRKVSKHGATLVVVVDTKTQNPLDAPLNTNVDETLKPLEWLGWIKLHWKESSPDFLFGGQLPNQSIRLQLTANETFRDLLTALSAALSRSYYATVRGKNELSAAPRVTVNF